MVYGLLEWGKKNTAERIQILSAPFLKVTLKQGVLPTRVRVRRWGRFLRKKGVTQAVLPSEFPYREELEKEGVFPVSTVRLRWEIAADWAEQQLREKNISLPEARVAVQAEVLSPEVVRTVTELALRHRYVWLSVPRGGEVLARRLSREYGVSLQLERGKGSEAVIEFYNSGEEGTAVTLRLWDETQPLPGLFLPPNQDQQLPRGAERGQLIAAMRSAALSRATAVRASLARGELAPALAAVPWPELLEKAEARLDIHKEDALT
ncbi:MAG: hypothetical protein IJE22_04300, partial [Oscillibacter sp.]|nr:hypothetical protein [Oscillibacter sp.]